MQYQQVLDFYNNEFKNNHWMKPNDLTDLKVTEIFIATHAEVINGENESWKESLDGMIAEIITADLFSRCIYRDDPKAFAYDPLAIHLAQNLLQQHPFEKLSDEYQNIVILPFIHSESKVIHDKLKIMLKEIEEQELASYAHNKTKLIHKFGRFPYRNVILGRESTPEELHYLVEHRHKRSHWSDEISSVVEDSLIH